MCDAVCATPLCDDLALRLSGPTLLDRGCCDQEAGVSLIKPFSVWRNHAAGASYPLLPLPDAPNAPNPAPRSRVLAGANRVLGGVLLRQLRRRPADCSGERFAALAGAACSAPDASDPNNAPFGVDPVFNIGTELYDPFINASKYYDKSELNSFGVPYGFFPSAASGEFIVLLDVNCNEERATAVLDYLEQGFFLDGLTDSLTVEVATYNNNLRVFLLMRVTFNFSPSGKIQARIPAAARTMSCR